MLDKETELAIELLTITCVSERDLYLLWDGTANKQSNKFIALVKQLAAKWEPEALPNGIDATISAVLEYWALD
jgi:hypothetical protein